MKMFQISLRVIPAILTVLIMWWSIFGFPISIDWINQMLVAEPPLPVFNGPGVVVEVDDPVITMIDQSNELLVDLKWKLFFPRRYVLRDA